MQTLMPRDTLMSSLIAKSAAAADAAAAPTAAQEAIANADAYLQNAVLPTYSDAIQAARNTVDYFALTAPGRACLVDELNPCGGLKHWGAGVGCPLCSARAILARHDRTMSGDFKG